LTSSARLETNPFGRAFLTSIAHHEIIEINDLMVRPMAGNLHVRNWDDDLIARGVGTPPKSQVDRARFAGCSAPTSFGKKSKGVNF
jgi:hypothetical protein